MNTESRSLVTRASTAALDRLDLTTCAVPVAIAVLLAPVLWAPVEDNTLLLNVVYNTAHGAVFAAVAVLCVWALRRIPRLNRRPLWLPYAISLIIVIALGTATEALQIPLARDASLGDLLNDVLGGALGLALFAIADRRLARFTRVALPLTGLLPLAALAMPLGKCLAAYAHRDAAFPALLAPERSVNGYFLGARWATAARETLPAPWARTASEWAVHVRFGNGPWPGIDLPEPVPDWSAYCELSLDVTNTNLAPLTITLRVQDRDHNYEYADRFNRSFDVEPLTRSVFAVPLTEVRAAPEHRELNLAEVADLMLFISRDDGRSTDLDGMFVSRIWLQGTAGRCGA